MLAGREFDERDQPKPPAESGGVALPVVLNQSAARGFFRNSNPIGKRVRDDKQSYEVVGVVRDLKDGTGISQRIVYVPLTRRDFVQPPAGGIIIVVRSADGPDSLSGTRSVIASIDPNLTLFDVQTLSQHLELSRSVMRSALRAYGGICLVGLVFSALAPAGVTAHSGAQRRTGLWIRLAVLA